MTARRLHTALLATVCGALTACSSFLDEDPTGSLTEPQAYASLDALKANALLTIYNYIGGHADSQGLQGTGRGVYDLNSLTTDEQIVPTRGGDWYDGGMWQGLYLHTYADAPTKDTWDYLFRVITLCNKGLEEVDAWALSDVGTEAEARPLQAELRALRALFYFYAMDLFGRVPLVTATTVRTSELVLAPRSATFRFCMEELMAAEPALPATMSQHPGEYYGRVTRPVAHFLLAKLALNGEVYADDDWTDGSRPDGTAITFDIDGSRLNLWQLTCHYCDLLTAAGYALEEDFAHNFGTTNEDSGENILTIPMDPTRYANWYTYFFRSRHYSHGAALGGASENGPSATIDVLRAFRYGQTDEDPRLRMTFYVDTVRENGAVVTEDDGRTPLVYHPWEVRLDLTGSPYEKTAGARIGKYAPDADANADGRACHNDIVLFRYADALLMRAEARVRQGRPDLAAADLDAVRARVALPSVAPTLENIAAERRLELCLEGWRRNDLVRFGHFADAWTDRPSLPSEATGYTTVFAIPADLMAMHPAWQQNPGY